MPTSKGKGGREGGWEGKGRGQGCGEGDGVGEGGEGKGGGRGRRGEKGRGVLPLLSLHFKHCITPSMISCCITSL